MPAKESLGCPYNSLRGNKYICPLQHEESKERGVACPEPLKPEDITRCAMEATKPTIPRARNKKGQYKQRL